MAVAVSTLGLTPAVVTEFIEELGKRNVSVSEVFLVTTKTSAVSSYALQLYFRLKGWKVKVNLNVIGVDDISSPNDCRTFRSEVLKVLKTAVKRAGGEDNVYVSLAGGRKTMPIDMFLAAMAKGIKNVYHVVAPGASDQNIFRVLRDAELEEVRRAAEDSKVRVSEELARKVEEICRPEENVNLIMVPMPPLSPEDMKALEESLKKV